MGKASFSVGKLTQHSQSHINRENGLNYAVVENSRANSFNKYYEYDEFLQKAQDCPVVGIYIHPLKILDPLRHFID